MIGIVDQKTITKAKAVHVNIAGGSVNKVDGRVRIFVKGKFPHTSGGYALRSRVVWWINTGEVLPADIDIHHKDENRTNDSFDNLERMDHIDHAHHHNPKTVVMVECVCKTCNGVFKLEKWRLKEKSRGQYCSQSCYQSRVRPSTLVSIICKECGSPYKVVPSRVDKSHCCSYSCSGIRNARARWGR